MSILEEIWHLRGEIDKGIKTHDAELIKKSLTRIRELFDNSALMKTEGSCTFNVAYWTDEQKRRDKFNNALSLLKNASRINEKYVNNNKEMSISFGEQPKSVITTLWVARAMLDDVDNKIGKKKFENRQRELLEIFEAVQQAINKCDNEIDGHHYTYEDRHFIGELRMHLKQIRKELFGDQQLLTGFAYHSQNY